MSYWTETGKYQSEVEKLEELVPIMGSSKTLKGEIFRAATRIYNDYFNNGFGNDWVSPAAFLISQVKLPPEVERK